MVSLLPTGKHQAFKVYSSGSGVSSPPSPSLHGQEETGEKEAKPQNRKNQSGLCQEKESQQRFGCNRSSLDELHETGQVLTATILFILLIHVRLAIARWRLQH